MFSFMFVRKCMDFLGVVEGRVKVNLQCSD